MMVDPVVEITKVAWNSFCEAYRGVTSWPGIASTVQRSAENAVRAALERNAKRLTRSACEPGSFPSGEQLIYNQGFNSALDDFTKPYTVGRVKRGLTWADAWESREEFQWVRLPSRGLVCGKVSVVGETCAGDGSFFAQRDFEVADNAAFEGE